MFMELQRLYNRVGKGPFPTELNDEIGEYIRNNGGEFGTTTWQAEKNRMVDAVIVRHAVRVYGLNYLVVNKLDTLANIDTLKSLRCIQKAGRSYY
jgi:adenylosuccinate synthase